jgi:hypothetical protein
MSIPLDRVYHYIERVSEEIHGDRIIIYGFFPDGSKKIKDLKQLNSVKVSRFDQMTFPCLISHEQEPLNFDLYNRSAESIDYAQNKFSPWAEKSQEILDLYLDMNLRMAIDAPLNGYDLVLLTHSEKNSEQLAKYQQAGFVGVYWWIHAAIARDWFRYAEHVTQRKQVQKTFLIYNRAWSGTREYRLKFAELLIQQRLHTHCQTAINSVEPETNKHYELHEFLDSQWRPNLVLENYFATNLVSSHASADFELSDYENTQIEVVLETLFDDSRWHLTEKILRPIALGQPFILAGTPGSLEYLRSYGFKTYDSIWPELYDHVTDSMARLESIIDVMNHIVNWNTDTMTLKMQQANQIAQYNKQLFFSEQFQQTIKQEFNSNFKQALDVLSNNRNGKYMLEIRNIKLQNPQLKELMDLADSQTGALENRLKLYEYLDIRFE